MSVVAIHVGVDGIDEPVWTALIPDAPDGSATFQAPAWREVAHRHWMRICHDLRDAGTLSAVNGHQIQRLVIAYIRYDLAAAKLMTMSPVLEAPKTGTPMVNLWQTELRAADSDATTAEMELCLNPRRRGSATKAARKEKRQVAADSYIGKKSA